MSKKTKSSPNPKKDRTRNDKGIVLEQIVAMLHKTEGVKVETNVAFHLKVVTNLGHAKLMFY